VNVNQVVAGIVVGLLLGAGAVYAGYSGENASLKQQVASLTAEKTSLTATASKVPTLEAQVAQLASNKAELEQQIADLSSQISQLNAQLTSLSSEKKTLESKVETLQAQVDALSSTESQRQILLLQQQLAEATVEVETLEASITALNSQISKLTIDKATLQTQVTSLNTQLQTLQKTSTSDFKYLDVSFSRTEDTSSSLRTWIARANSTIYVAIYSFTQDELGDALVAANDRGIDVRVFMEGENVNGLGSEYVKLVSAGITVRSDTRSALMHHKFMVVDGKVVATGSYNWSASAEDSNDENLLIVRSVFLADDYAAELNRLWALGA